MHSNPISFPIFCAIVVYLISLVWYFSTSIGTTYFPKSIHDISGIYFWKGFIFPFLLLIFLVNRFLAIFLTILFIPYNKSKLFDLIDEVLNGY